ncbi:efflux transporter outer membrane subunit [Acidovorax sp. GBBC 3334]|uniref:efflux transporter outer membrane subunit n=1 Tax=unclassified Acidovorax TaxID=2684926 RepID=UPI0023037908|nr:MULTISPECIES: efflux transporter outer membrane subunit [unclassified Acidovorax]MDA8456688.1 efflux transporter outer membrane subunit [Acidovorax sp. GBBC 3334]MDA8522895.1 efflux transporter outer membrane subunit [Acidovorax sp. NCPPB 4044]
MHRLSTFAALLLAGLTSGCAVGPDYRQPETPMPAAFMGIRPAEVAASPASPSTVDLSAWWRAFGDPQLTHFVSLALQQNLDLAQASARVLQARAGLQASTAALLPSGSAAAQTARSYQSVETPLGRLLDATPGFDRYGNAHEATLSASWELDLFGGLRRARQASLAEYQSAEAGAAAVHLAIAAQTADIYLQIRGLQARIAVARQQVQTQQQLRSTIDLRWKKGLAAELQVRQVEGALARTQATLPVLEAALEAAMNAMDGMLGAMPGAYRAELAAVRPVPATLHLAPSGTPGDLLRRRPDIIAAERRLAASNARIGVAMAEYYPKISLSGLVGSATSVSSGNLFTGGASQAGAVAGLRWRLFDFGRIDAQIENARAQEAEALAAYRQTVLRATEDVENSLVALDRRREQASRLAEGAGSLTRARQAAGAAYDKGVVSLIEVLQADESLLGTVDAQVQADTEAARSAVSIFKALGGGWTPTPAVSAPIALNE